MQMWTVCLRTVVGLTAVGSLEQRTGSSRRPSIAFNNLHITLWTVLLRCDHVIELMQAPCSVLGQSDYAVLGSQRSLCVLCQP